jgi:NTE family protein
VLRRLEAEGFRVAAIAGTSFGGIVASLYASGYSPQGVLEAFLQVDQSRLYSRSSEERPALLGLTGVRKWLEEIIGKRTFADLEIPCALTAVDLNCGCEVILDEGRVSDAILATIAVPGIFPSFPWNEWELVDGGVLNPVPVAVARTLAPSLPVVAVSLHTPIGEPARSMSVPVPSVVPKPILDRLVHIRFAQAFDIFLRSVDIGNRAMAEYRLKTDKPEVVIRPAVSDIGLLQRVDVGEVAQRGDQAVIASLGELKKLSSWTNRLRRRLIRGNP